MILIYHMLSEDSPYLYSVSRHTMEQHLQVLTEQQTVAGSHGEPCITFDDGHVSQYEAALPLLEQYSSRAIFFITPDWTGNRSSYMSWAQLREIVRLGHKVESHGWSHKFLTQCSLTELKTELWRSKQVLEDGLGIPVEALAVPNGAWNQQVLAECAAAGYQRVYTSDPFVRRIEKTGLEVLGRIAVQRNMSPARLRRLARAEHNALSGVRMRHYAKRAVRGVLGQQLYHRLWCRLAQSNSQVETNGSYEDVPLARR